MNEYRKILIGRLAGGYASTGMIPDLIVSYSFKTADLILSKIEEEQDEEQDKSKPPPIKSSSDG